MTPHLHRNASRRGSLGSLWRKSCARGLAVRAVRTPASLPPVPGVSERAVRAHAGRYPQHAHRQGAGRVHAFRPRAVVAGVLLLQTPSQLRRGTPKGWGWLAPKTRRIGGGTLPTGRGPQEVPPPGRRLWGRTGRVGHLFVCIPTSSENSGERRFAMPRPCAPLIPHAGYVASISCHAP